MVHYLLFLGSLLQPRSAGWEERSEMNSLVRGLAVPAITGAPWFTAYKLPPSSIHPPDWLTYLDNFHYISLCLVMHGGLIGHGKPSQCGRKLLRLYLFMDKVARIAVIFNPPHHRNPTKCVVAVMNEPFSPPILLLPSNISTLQLGFLSSFIG